MYYVGDSDELVYFPIDVAGKFLFSIQEILVGHV